MKIGVLLKQVPDTETRIRVKADGSAIEEGDIKWIVNPYDEFAVEEALKLKESSGGGEVVVMSLGPARCVDAARTALAMGADRAVILDDAGFQGSDSLGVARALAAAVQKEGLDVVFAGKQAIDDDAVQVPQAMATLLGWPCATTITSFARGGAGATVKRPVGGGIDEQVEIAFPAVLTCDKGLNTPRYASLPGIMKAKTKPVKKYTPAELGVAGDVGAANTKVKLSRFRLPPGRSAGRVLGGELPAQVTELVRLLREEAKVL